MECELVVRGRRQSTREESAGEDPEDELEVETDDDEEDGWLGVGKRSASAIAYFITDSEKFAPPKKKAKVVRRTYRMLALVSTSPEELYNRKILLEEYGEAIMLAQHYGLDTDSVYRFDIVSKFSCAFSTCSLFFYIGDSGKRAINQLLQFKII